MAIKLGEAMVTDSFITKEQLRLVLERQVIFGGRIGTNLVELGMIKESDLASFLSKFHNVPAVDSSKLASVDSETISCINRELAEKYKVIPFKKERNKLHIAMLDPISVHAVDELRFTTGFNIIPYVITELRFLYALEKYYKVKRDVRYIGIFDKENEQEMTKDGKEEHLKKIKEEFANAKAKEEIIGIVLNEAGKIASRVAVFIIKGDKLSGWKSKGLAVENIEIKTDASSIFSDVLNRRSYYRGPLMKIPGNEPLIKLLSGTSQDCIMIPINIRDKVIALLYADNGNASVMDASLSYINTLVSLASISFEIVILRNKILAL